MTWINAHLTPAEKRKFDSAEQNMRHHRLKLQDAQRIVRRLKDLARKRYDAQDAKTREDAR